MDMGPPGVLLSSTNDMIVTPTRSTRLCNDLRNKYSVTAFCQSRPSRVVLEVARCGTGSTPELFLVVASCGLLPRAGLYARSFFDSRKLRLAPQGYAPWTPRLDRSAVLS